MKCLMDLGNRYVKESDWKTMALLKLCLCAMGVMIGLKVPKKKMRVWGCAAFSVFVACYVPLMWKLVELWRREGCREIG